MPKIPVGDFGYTALRAAPSGRANIVNFESITNDARSLQQFGNVLGDVGDNIARVSAQQQAEQKRKQDEMARAKTANALLDHELYSKTVAEGINEEITTGVIKYQDAEKVFQERMAKAPTFEMQDIDPVLTENYQRGIKRNLFSAQAGVFKAAQKAEFADYKAQFELGLDKLGKMGGMPGADIAAVNTQAEALKAIAKNAGMNDAEVAKRLQTFKDNNWFNQASQLSNQYSDSIDGLGRLKHELVDKKGFYADKLDPEKRTSLIRSIDQRIDVLNNRATHLADKQEARAMRTLDDMDKQFSTGIPATSSQWAKWSATVKGTQYEADFQERAKAEQEIQKVLRQPIEAQIAYVQKAQQDASVNGADTRQQANLKRITTAVDANIKLLKETPLIFSQNRTGIEVAPIDFMNEESMSDNLKERFATIGALRKQYGIEVSQNPWMPQETDQLKQVMATSDDKTKLELLGSIAKASPDGASYASAIKTIAADKPALALAGMAHYRGFKSKTGRDVASTILKGDKILADKSVIMPTENALRAAFEQGVGNALPDGSPQREQAFVAFKSLYAGLADEMGVRHVNEDKNYANVDVTESALSLATGGISTKNGRKVIRPYGMSEDKFDDALDAQLNSIAAGNGFDIDDLEDLPMVAVPGVEGSYYLMNGNKILPAKDGRPVIVRIK